nr:hypothetical protein HAGR004_26550 [Bdellovibrio sp. HAGR004]
MSLARMGEFRLVMGPYNNSGGRMSYLRLALAAMLFSGLVSCAEKIDEPVKVVGSPLPVVDVKCGESSCL